MFLMVSHSCYFICFVQHHDFEQALEWSHTFTEELPGDRETRNSLRQVRFAIELCYFHGLHPQPICEGHSGYPPPSTLWGGGRLPWGITSEGVWSCPIFLTRDCLIKFEDHVPGTPCLNIAAKVSMCKEFDYATNISILEVESITVTCSV